MLMLLASYSIVAYSQTDRTDSVETACASPGSSVTRDSVDFRAVGRDTLG